MDRRVLALTAATFGVGTQTFSFTGSLAPLAQGLGVGVATAGQIVTAYAVVFAVAGPVLVVLLARVDRKRLLWGALAAVSALNVAAALASDFAALLGLRALVGVPAALVNPVAAGLAVSLVAPEQRGRALALVLGGLTVAFVAGIPMGSVVAEAFGWRATFVFGALVTAAAAAVIAVAVPPGPAASARAGLAAFRSATRPAVAGALLLSLIGFSASFPVVAYLGPVITAVTGFEGSRLAVLQALVGVGSVAGVLVGGPLADRPRGFAATPLLFGLIGLSQLAYAALLGAWFVAPGTSVAVVLLGLTIAASALVQFALMPLVQTRVVATAGDGRDVALALNGSLIVLGQGVGAALGGLAQVLGGGLAAMGLAGAAVSVLGIALAAALARPVPARDGTAVEPALRPAVPSP